MGRRLRLELDLAFATAGMASTFLVRLKVGPILVDAKGVSRLYNPGVGGSLFALFMLVSLVLIAVVVASSDSLREFVQLVWLKVRVSPSASLALTAPETAVSSAVVALALLATGASFTAVTVIVNVAVLLTRAPSLARKVKASPPL